MRAQTSNPGQQSGSNDQKKSVFDRLGRQIDAGSSMKHRPSPGPYGEYMAPPLAMHEPEFGRYPPRDPHAQAEMEWRYQNDRRHLPPGYPRDRPPPPPMTHPPSHPVHYEMEMASRQPPYYPHPHPHPYLGSQPGMPPPMGPGGMMPMGMHQQRSSPKYDRHGNPVPFKDRSGPGPMRMSPMDHHPGMSPPRNYPGMPPGSMIPPGPHEMPPMRPGGMYPPPRWHEGPESDFLAHGGRMLPEDRFSPATSHRFQHQAHQMMNMPPHSHPGLQNEGPRYTKWRERRDVITNLDRETAQSSSRTDSLKSTLQQPDLRTMGETKATSNASREHRKAAKQQSDVDLKTSETVEGPTVSDTKSSKATASIKREPEDISDGEIVGDDDSSDDSEINKPVAKDNLLIGDANFMNRDKSMPSPYRRARISHHFYGPSKKRRFHERDDCSMDYETISDDDLDDFMDEKKIASSVSGKLVDPEDRERSTSELNLLNALGLDWANLVEMAKQSRNSTKDAYTPGSALPRFMVSNYLPTLGITKQLVGAEIYELMQKACMKREDVASFEQ